MHSIKCFCFSLIFFFRTFLLLQREKSLLKLQPVSLFTCLGAHKLQMSAVSLFFGSVKCSKLASSVWVHFFRGRQNASLKGIQRLEFAVLSCLGVLEAFQKKGGRFHLIGVQLQPPEAAWFLPKGFPAGDLPPTSLLRIDMENPNSAFMS